MSKQFKSVVEMTEELSGPEFVAELQQTIADKQLETEVVVIRHLLKQQTEQMERLINVVFAIEEAVETMRRSMR